MRTVWKSFWKSFLNIHFRKHFFIIFSFLWLWCFQHIIFQLQKQGTCASQLEPEVTKGSQTMINNYDCIGFQEKQDRWRQHRWIIVSSNSTYLIKTQTHCKTPATPVQTEGADLSSESWISRPADPAKETKDTTYAMKSHNFNLSTTKSGQKKFPRQQRGSDTYRLRP